jgi:hypothetical protein
VVRIASRHREFHVLWREWIEHPQSLTLQELALGSKLNGTGFSVFSLLQSAWRGFSRKLVSEDTITLGTRKSAELPDEY